MPFQVDLVVTPFDTVTSTVTGESLFVTLVEAAWVEFNGLSIQPIISENPLVVNKIWIRIRYKNLPSVFPVYKPLGNCFR